MTTTIGVQVKKTLTIVSFAGGQDSSAIMGKILFDSKFRAKYAPGDLLFIFADTLNEHPETYKWIETAKEYCKKESIPFAHLKPGVWATGDWKNGLLGFYRAGNRIGSKCFPKTCSDKLKIGPIYKYVEMFIHASYGTEKVGRKRAIKEFTDAGNEINVLIGFAKGEEKRVADPSKFPKWQQRINRLYPLIDIGYDRKYCQDYLFKTFGYCPPPSNCMVCPFIDKKELLLLYHDYRAMYEEWVDLEAAKLESNNHVDRNLGVFGDSNLIEILEEAKKEYGDMTIDDLREHRFSHGHCVATKY